MKIENLERILEKKLNSKKILKKYFVIFDKIIKFFE
jgi:hypothetical protein